MPIAAIPAYLGNDFKDSSPGMRFSMYLSIWTNRGDQEDEVNERKDKKSREAEEIRAYLDRYGMDATIDSWLRRERNPLPSRWSKNDRAARGAWQEAGRLTPNDLDTMRALVKRQSTLAESLQSTLRMFCIEGRTVAPFTTGLGNEHPLENGFAFLNPYGLPYLSGSGIKGVVRQAAQELARGEWGDTVGWSTQKTHILRVANANLSLSMIDVMFGLEPNENETRQFRGVLTFWDVIPQINDGDSLLVEVMTPHQTHYYQQSESPHESGKPNPILFLTVPPQSKIAFYVVCDVLRLSRISPDLAADGRWQQLVEGAFAHAFSWLGFGAKTSLGYGAMRIDQKAKDERTARVRETQKRNALEKEIKLATASLPEDVAWLVEKLHSKAWPENDNSAFLKDIEWYFSTQERLSALAYTKFTEELERRWKGIMSDPDAVEGKKRKPKFKERQKALAKRLLELKPSPGPETAG